MKTIISIMALAAGLLFAANAAQAENLKKTYCGNQEFYGITADHDGNGKSYPHLHCKSKIIAYSPGKKPIPRINFLDKGGLSVSKAANACLDSNAKGTHRLTAKIALICAEYGADCGC